MIWSVVVVAKGMWPVTQRCLETLLETTNGKTLDLIYLDNGMPASENSWEQAVKWSWETYKCKVLKFEKAVSLAHAWNVGFGMTYAQYCTDGAVLFINNDLIFKKSGWLEQFEIELRKEDVGITGMLGMSWFFTPFIQGSIFAIRPKQFYAGGEVGFDERFVFTCEETDINCRIQRDGYKISQLPHLKNEYIEHMEGATRNYYRSETTAYQRLAHISRLEYSYKWLSKLGPGSGAARIDD